MNEEVLENNIVIVRAKDGISVSFDYQQISEISAFVERNNVSTLYFKKMMEGDNIDLSIINTWDKIEKLSIIRNVVSFKEFPILKNIKELFINDFSREVDFSRFPNIEHCTLDWNNKIKNIEECKKLSHLVIWKYNPKSKDFIPLSALKKLKHLEIRQSNILSLNGIEKLTGLQKLELYYTTKLTTLKGIGKLKNTLEYLFVDNSKKIEDHFEVKELSKLQTLALNDCGEIKTLDFVEEMPNLIDLRFVNSNIVDGNLNVCERVKRVIFNDKRHYTHKYKQFKT